MTSFGDWVISMKCMLALAPRTRFTSSVSCSLKWGIKPIAYFFSVLGVVKYDANSPGSASGMFLGSEVFSKPESLSLLNFPLSACTIRLGRHKGRSLSSPKGNQNPIREVAQN